MTDISNYPALVFRDDEGEGYYAVFPDLPGCMGDGDTREEALSDALEAAECWLEVQLERGVEIPEPGAQAVEFEHRIEALIETIAELSEKLYAAEQQITILKRNKHGEQACDTRRSRIFTSARWVSTPALAR